MPFVSYASLRQITTMLTAVQASLKTLNTNVGKLMSALTDLQAADAALKTEVATFLADIAAALGAEDPDIESVVADINAQVAALQKADPGASATA